MLTDIRHIHKHQRDELTKLLAEISTGTKNSQHPQKGIYIDHLNFNHEVLSKIRSAQMYHDPWLIEHYKKTIREREERKEQPNPYDAKELASYLSVPNNIEQFYKRENWKHVHNNEESNILGYYGVCDSVEQLLSLYDFEADPRKLVILMTEIRREDQSPEDGWRWHKWGEYVGLKEPQFEYLYDEQDIESVMVYNIYEVLD